MYEMTMNKRFNMTGLGVAFTDNWQNLRTYSSVLQEL